MTKTTELGRRRSSEKLALNQIVLLYQGGYLSLGGAKDLAKKHAEPITHGALLKKLHGPIV